MLEEMRSSNVSPLYYFSAAIVGSGPVNHRQVGVKLLSITVKKHTTKVDRVEDLPR